MLKLTRFIGSRMFFACVLLLFVGESLWVVFTLRFPGIFDESWHLQVIELYSKQLSPFIEHQASSSYNLGALTRDPSFLYHYLLSFPYRLIAHITQSVMWQVIVLRLLDVCFFVIAIILYRLVLLKAAITRPMVHLCIFFFVLIPVVPFLAGQINYDNLLMPLTAASLLVAIQFEQRLSQGIFDVWRLVILAVLLMVAAMTQFEFLAILLGVVLYIIWGIWKFFVEFPKDARVYYFRKGNLLKKIVITVVFISTAALFFHSYGLNLIKYHSPTPSCNRVLTTDQCLEYYAFNRNYVSSQLHIHVNENPIVFTVDWGYRLFETSYYTVLNGAQIPLQVLPLPLPALATMAIMIGGVAALVVHCKKLFNSYPYLSFLLFVSFLYLCVLWFHNYEDFKTVGIKVGINGRYLFPIILPIMALIGVAYQEMLRRYTRTKLIVLVLASGMFIDGGGIALYVLSGDTSWWWQKRSIIHLAEWFKVLLQPFVIRFNLFR